ncbi:MAG: glycogen synthase [Candidatus Electrothrix sp. YB6]
MEKVRNIVMVTREYDGLAGAGGVKDVCRQLAEALAWQAHCDVQVILPCYGFMYPVGLGFQRLQVPSRKEASRGTVFTVDMNYPSRERREPVSIWMKEDRGLTIYLLDSPRFAEKKAVYTYTAEEETEKDWQKAGSGHFDYFAMNVLLQKACLDMLILLDLRPDIIHCHDGHAAILPAMIREQSGYRHFFCQTGAVVTIHNAGIGYHQEVEDLGFARSVTGLPDALIRSGQFNNAFNPFVAAAGYAQMNTVSENYARELQGSLEDSRTGWLGHELLRREVRLAGITNGINPEDFDPQQPEKLGTDAAFNPETGDLGGKWICKEKMLAACSLCRDWPLVRQHGSLTSDPALPLFTFIGRLTAQKGVDILLRAVSLLAAEGEHGLQLLLLGSGEKYLEAQLRELADDDSLNGRLCFLQGYDPMLATKIYAAGDFFLIPSLYEPCGLTDYIAQLLGNIPLVRHVGGLVKVRNGETGFAYQEHTPEALAGIIRWVLGLYRDAPEQLTTIRRAAVQRIRTHHTWQQVMEEYLELYQQAL